MSEVVEETWHPPVTRLQFPALIVGVAGLVVCLLAMFLGDATRNMLLRSWLWAYMFWLGLPAGCLGVLMLQHLTGGRWGLTIRRMLEAGAVMILPMAVLFVPLFLSVGQIYPWANGHAEVTPEHTTPAAHPAAATSPATAEAGLTPGTGGEAIARGPVDPYGTPTAHPRGDVGAVESHHEIEGFKRWWLDPTHFRIRAIIYFGVWLVWTLLLLTWSHAEDRNGDPRHLRRLQLISGPGLVLYALTMTGAVFDWVMSLDPHWYSTMFGVIFIVGQVLSCFAFVIALIALLHDREPLAGLIDPTLLNDLGNLMMAFVLIFAYVSFSQYLIIWSGNLSEETPFYYFRTHGGWQWVAFVIVLFHFAVPFLLLLWRRNKRHIKPLAMIALGVIVMRWVDLFWVIIPAFLQGKVDLRAIPNGAPSFPVWQGLHWTLPAALAGIGGLWVALYAWQLKRRPLLPLHDARLAEVSAHGH